MAHKSSLKPYPLFFCISLCFCFFLCFPSPARATTTVRFLYDGDGNRVAKIKEGKTTLYVGETEIDKDKGETTRYYSQGGKRVAVSKSSSTNSQLLITNYLISDHLGSTRSLTDSTGSLIPLRPGSGQANSRISYFPYGQLRLGLSSDVPSRQYTSQINDDSTGLYFYNARYYNPTTANFLSADRGNSMNKYIYVNGNPILRNDPTGNEDEDTVNDCTVNPLNPSCLTLNPSSNFSPLISSSDIINSTIAGPTTCAHLGCTKEQLEDFQNLQMEMTGKLIFAATATMLIAAAGPVALQALSQILPRMTANVFRGIANQLFKLQSTNTLEQALIKVEARIIESITGIPTVLDISGRLKQMSPPAGGALRFPNMPAGEGGIQSLPEILLPATRSFSTFSHETVHAFQWYFTTMGRTLFGVSYNYADDVVEAQAYRVSNAVQGVSNTIGGASQQIQIQLQRWANQINPK